ncbi:hypothetical protein [Yinghuangia seranimata]|uniref:hypothetical protein n=1 Tax=Yinghuangia seranimata TaxID=408067 RepID=UPI00248D1280|nr:hypothetical protein [Yinghuangia seranimata]MDI2124860.1 hypothetical protein [Yinghuangia seranimata]
MERGSITRAVVAAGLAVFAAAGCASSDDAASGSSPTPTASTGRSAPPHSEQINADPVRFAVDLPAGGAVSDAAAGTYVAKTCPPPPIRVDLDAKRSVTFMAWPTSCAPSTQKPGNGNHGVYRTAADVPADAANRTTVATPLGEATVFEQQYYECTNSCHTWTEPVAVVTLATPPDATHTALVALSAKGTVTAKDLAEFLRTHLHPAAG